MQLNHCAAVRCPPGMFVAPSTQRVQPANPCGDVKVGRRVFVGNQAVPGEVRHLVEKVKAAQKTGEEVRTQWRDYCDTFGNGTRDPSKHGDAFLFKFFELQALGNVPVRGQPLHERAMPGLECDPKEAFAILVAKVKYGRQASRDFNAAWRSFCAISATQKTDPEHHDANALDGFLTSCVASKGCFSNKNPYAAPPLFEASPLAETVKSMQSARLAWKHTWDNFCDSKGGGVRDPARHPPEFLQQFIDSVAPTYSQGRQISRAAARGGGKHASGPPSTREGAAQRRGLRSGATPFVSKEDVCADRHPLESKPSIDTAASNDDTASTHTYDGNSSSGSPSSRQRSYSHPPSSTRSRSCGCASAAPSSARLFGLPLGYRVRNTFIELDDSSPMF